MRLRSVAAVGVGGLTGLFLGLVVAALLSSMRFDAPAGRLPPARLRQPAADAPEALPTPVILAPTRLEPLPASVSLLVSFATTAAGGYVAARIARRAAVVHGALSAWPMPTFAVAWAVFVTTALRQPPEVGALDVARLALYPIAGAVGGAVRGWQSTGGR